MAPPSAQFKLAKKVDKQSPLGRALTGKKQSIATIVAAVRKPVTRTSDSAGAIPRGSPSLPGQDLAPPALAIPDLAAVVRKPLNRLLEKTLTVKEAAYRLGKSSDSIYLWLRSGRLQGWQPGGAGCAILVSEPSVNDALLCSFERASAGRSAAGLRGSWANRLSG